MTTFTGSIAAILAGQAVKSVPIDTWHDALQALTDPWTAYTPAWSSSGTQPVLGNGTLTGKYVQTGKFVTCSGKLTYGSTTTFGTGIYAITLPVTAAADLTACGSGLFFRSTSVAFCTTVFLRGTTTLEMFPPSGGQWTPSNPINPQASGDLIDWQITYEAA